jgi:hypothetical protein
MPGSTLEERIAGLVGACMELTRRIDDMRQQTHRSLDLIRVELDGRRAQVNSSRAQFRAEIRDRRTELGSSFCRTMSLLLINRLGVPAAIFLVAGKR